MKWSLRWRIVLFACSVAIAFRVHAQTQYVPVEQLWHFTTATTTKQDVGNWSAAAGKAIWLLHPDGYVARRFKEAQRKGNQATRAIRVDSVKLPAGIAPADLPTLDLSIAAANDETIWLVDHTRWRVWRYEAGKWHGPWAMGETIGSVAAGRAGELIVNTPGHSMHSFATIRPDGTIGVRFGDRLQPWRFGMDEDWNRWAIGVVRDGRIVAAHRYSDRLRAYDARFKLLWEKAAEFPTVGAFRAAAGSVEASIRVHPTCCYAAKLVLFASRVIPLTETHFGVQYGLAGAVEELTENGEWRSTVPLRRGEGDTRLFGLSSVEEGVVAVDAHGAARYERIADDRLIEGKVVTEDGQAIQKATLALVSAFGAKFNARTDDSGRFAVVVANRSDWHDVTVSAPGYRTWSHHGTLDRLRRPIILFAPLEQCVHVFDATTGQPVERFDVEILRESFDQKSATRTQGARESFTAADGSACLDSPWEYPWSVKITSEGYAAEKIKVEQGLLLDVALTPGATLEVAVREASGTPVEGVSLRLIRAEDAQRAVVIVEDEGSATTDADGNARFTGLREGQYKIAGTSDRFLPFAENVAINMGVNLEEITLAKGSSLRIRVLAQGKEVPEAVVMAELLSGTSGRLLQCTTGSDGRCAIQALGPGRYQARARAQGMVEGHRPFEVAPDANEVEVELRLEQSVRLTGIAERRARYPNLDLDVMGSKPGVPYLFAPVDAQGGFAFEEFPSGDVNMRVKERGRDSTLVYQRLTIPSGRTAHQIVLRLPDPYLIEGTIRYQNTGCGPCSLVFEGLGSGIDKPQIIAKVAPSGTYAADIPGSGLYVARASAPDGAMDRRILEINGARREDFTLDDLDRTTVSVVDERGTPIEAARVLAIDVARGVSLADLTTNARGVASLPRLTNATRIVASKDRAQGSVVHSGGGRAVEIVIRQSGELQLDLRDARTGAPIYRAQVRMRSSRTGLDAGSQLLTRSDEQPFVITTDDVPDLIIKAPGYAFKTVYAIPTSSGVQRVHLSGGLTLGIRIDERLRPCGFELTGDGGRTYGLSTEFPLGPIPLTTREVIFNPIEAGTYTATLYTCDGARLQQNAIVSPGERTPLVVFDR